MEKAGRSFYKRKKTTEGHTGIPVQYCTVQYTGTKSQPRTFLPVPVHVLSVPGTGTVPVQY